MESDTALRYWRERLAGFAQPTVPGGWANLPAAGTPDRTRSALSWAPERVAALDRAATAAGVTAEHLVTASWSLVLAAHAGEGDVLFGVLTGRDKDGVPLPVRLQPDPELAVGAYLRSVRETEEAGRRHGALTADEFAACSELTADTPLFGTSLACGRAGAAEPPPAPYGIGVGVSLSTREPGLAIDHPSGVLPDDHARRLLGHLDRMTALLADTSADADTAIGDLTVLPPGEYARVVHEWNDTAADHGPAACLHELFEARAARQPNALAVVQGGDRLTYAELDAASDRLAARLAAAGVRSGDMVALAVRRTVHAVVALLGVLKSGAAYTPVDPGLPAERFRELVETLSAPVVLTDHDAVPEIVDRCQAPLPALREVLWLGGDGSAPSSVPGGPVTGWALAEVPPNSPAPDRARPEDVAYTLFTSGSTGTPKGVLMAHAPAVNLIRWVNETYRVGSDDQILLVASLSFDLSVYDVFGLLAAGGSIRVASDEEVHDPQRLLQILDDEPVTFWDSAPAALQQLQPFFALREPTTEHSLRLVFLSGDWVPLALPQEIRSAFAEPEVVALGGATEAAIWSNHFPVRRVDPGWASIPYGRPIDNARYHVLDTCGNPSPVGAPGDLYIGGACLGEGYLGDPRLTAAKFLPDPFSDEPGGRLYRTGDRARRWADGTIEFLGRQDDQVKIRGFRIELGEVEAALAALADVTSAVVLVHGAGTAARLVAYAVPCHGARPDADELRTALARRLPVHMVPAQVVVMDALPVTANGKLDREALPVPAAGGADRPEYEPPRTPVEKAVAQIWAEVLDTGDVGAGDNFFDLGGHSVLMTQVAAILQSDLGVEIPLLALLENQTLSAFSTVVEQVLAEQIDAELAVADDNEHV